MWKTKPHFLNLQALEFLLNRRALAPNAGFAPRHQRSLRGARGEGTARRLQLPHIPELGGDHGAVTPAPCGGARGVQQEEMRPGRETRSKKKNIIGRTIEQENN